jgi:CheY-like chemotaxis protein
VGLEVSTADDGAAGLAVVLHDSPSCVLVNLHMHPMDGFEFLTELQRCPVTPPPVFVITHYNDAATRERAQQLGADAIFTQTEAMQRDFAVILKGLLTMMTEQRQGPGALRA